MDRIVLDARGRQNFVDRRARAALEQVESNESFAVEGSQFVSPSST
jgi:hypothetical protein